jgi:Fic family protein
MEFRIPVTGEILNLVAHIDHFRGSWNGGAVIPPERRARLERIAAMDSTVAACRLAGIPVTPEQVEALAGEGTAETNDDRQILGFLRALELRSDPPRRVMGTEDIGRLHAVMLGDDSEDPAPTPWRDVILEREAFDENGRALGLVMATLPPRLVPEKMEDLVTWLELELRSREQHPLLVIGTFVLGFLAASPFPKGNERLEAVLTVHLLEGAGYDYIRTASLERIFNEDREEFARAYDLSQTRIWTGESDLRPWSLFFLEVLKTHCGRVADLVAEERQATRFSPLQRAIVDTIRHHGTAEAGLLLRTTGANRNTLKDNLRRLVEKGVLEKMGQRRGTRYRIKL